MCKKAKGLHNRIDPCIKPLIKWLNERGYHTIASCCGHNRYPITVVVQNILKKEGVARLYSQDYFIPYELFNGIDIPRKRKFYKKDKKGYYYIPEVINGKTKRVNSLIYRNLNRYVLTKK